MGTRHVRPEDRKRQGEINPYRAPVDDDSIHQQPEAVTRERVVREVLYLFAYFASIIVLPFLILWMMDALPWW